MTRFAILRTAVTFTVVAAVAVGLSLRRPNLQTRTVAPIVLDSTVAASGADDGIVYEVDWRTLAGLDPRTGVPSAELRQLHGRTVRIPGYIVPLDDFADAVTEFLLVPYYGACIHTPPPPPNQMVQVRVERNVHASSSWQEPVWIEGRLEIRAVLSPYGVVAYQMRTDNITAYTEPR
jgi:hypothetical protein